MPVIPGRDSYIRLYMPEAEAVSLIVEDYDVSQPLKKDSKGFWRGKLRHSIQELAGQAYHFTILQGGHVFTIADPLAHRTQRDKREITSYFADIQYRWQHAGFTAPPMRDIVIYETHLPALSRHQSSGVKTTHRGTYLGTLEPFILDHLQHLQVAVEFLPLHANDKLLGQDWGYFSTSFHAMREDYAVNEKEVNKEVMAVVDTLHGRGIPVLLDVVFNHGGELWVKAWGETIVYRKLDNGYFCQGSGCGSTIQTEHPFVRNMIIETLQHLVKHYRFDGFRFDLGALHDRQTMIEIDRQLPKQIYLVAEPWALGGAQWDKGTLAHDFANTRWSVWNDDFREPAKTFLMGKGDHHNRDRLMNAITGNHVRYGGWALRPQQCINYLTSHDGLTLADYVKGDKKRAFLGLLMVLTSQGVPMISEGSEFMFSKKGHHNSYNRPDLNQINWNNSKQHWDLVEAVAQLIELRKQYNHFRYTQHVRRRHGTSLFWDIDWIYPTGYPHNDNVNTIGFLLKPPPRRFHWRSSRKSLLILLNGSHQGAKFNLPRGSWKLLVDGNAIAVNLDGISKVPPAQGDYHVHPGTGVVLAPQ